MWENEVSSKGEEVPVTPAMEEQTPAEEIAQEEEVTETTTDEQPESQAENVKTVPLEVVESMREQMKEIKEQNKLLQNLLLSQKQEQPQSKAEPDPDIDPDTFLTYGQVKQLLEKKLGEVNQTREQDRQATREERITSYEATFRESNPDYDEVVKAIPTYMVKALFDEISDPRTLVENAYKFAKALNGGTAAPKPQVKPKAEDVAGKIQQNQNKPKTITAVKGTSATSEVSLSPEQMFRDRFGG